ncbi:hypothetical protein K525DRAFT_228355 [Schizophyllum commune Loenen D]|nr:hypothetical protein K525DRAFT_228355 [Schizophyllum commune Loenen D]
MPAETARTYLQPQKSPSRQSLSLRKSSASLRGLPDENAVGQHSLAHELAVALMPEPSAGSRLLAEEFGIEYDEGAEGIDSDPHAAEGNPDINVEEPSFADHSFEGTQDEEPSEGATEDVPQDMDPEFGEPAPAPQRAPRAPEQDPMQVLAQNLESTDKFLVHLRTVDSTDANPLQHQSTLERIAGDVIRRLEETVRDREGQVRELLEYEREFRKIAGEVGGNDALSHLDELQNDIADEVDAPATSPTTSRAPRMEDSMRHSHGASTDWDVEEPSPSTSPTATTFKIPPPPPNPVGPPTPAATLPHLTHVRTITTSLVASLTTISEQAQVTGAATTDAGRRLRALKNKLGGWRTEWEAAERSRLKIEKWEQDIARGAVPNRRQEVEEHLKAFELALKDAGLKTDAIMAAS